MTHNLPGSPGLDIVEGEARGALLDGTPRFIEVDGSRLFIETVVPPIRLLVFGAGDDAVPLTDLAHYLGWNVHVFDGRAHYARKEKFPNAHSVTVRRGGDAAAAVDSWTAAVLMNHSYSQDLEVLSELSARPPLYLGILGPRKRSLQLLADAGIETSQLGPALHSPMGLDIGADGPEQVAVSVVAEIQAYLNRRTGGELRERSGSIHARDEESDSSSFRVRSIVCA